FVPGELGDIGERRVYKLDLLEREPSECVVRLERYLQYSAVCSGLALDAAREDDRASSRDREIRSALPTAWMQLVEQEDMLAELLAEKVESVCGFKPEADVITEFLKIELVLRREHIAR